MRIQRSVPDVALLDEDTSVVDGLGETELVDTSLETTLQEVLDLEGQDVIELHAGLVEHTDTHETANQGVTLEETLGVLLVHGEELTKEWVLVEALRLGHKHSCCCARLIKGCIPGSTTNLGESELDAPDLTLVAETILSDNLELRVPILLLIRHSKT